MNRVLALSVLAVSLAASSASAEGFVDVYGGSMNFLPTSTLQNVTNCSGGPCTTELINGSQWAELVGVHQQSSATGGIRVGSLRKADYFSYGAAFNLQSYGVKEQEYFYDPSHGAYRSNPGGTVVQPGVDAIVGIPVRFLRLYGGAGLNVPIMFYDYQAVNSAGTTTNSNVGASATMGYDLFFGARWLVTNNVNFFLEDRFGGIFMPIAIKDSVRAADGSVDNGTLVINSLNSNAIVAGIGFAW